MAKVIYKYHIPVVFNGREIIEIKLPKHAYILHIGVQDSNLFLWAKIDNMESSMETISIMVIGTGIFSQPGDPSIYRGTVFLDGYVWHIFSDRKI